MFLIVNKFEVIVTNRDSIIISDPDYEAGIVEINGIVNYLASEDFITAKDCHVTIKRKALCDAKR